MHDFDRDITYTWGHSHEWTWSTGEGWKCIPVEFLLSETVWRKCVHWFISFWVALSEVQNLKSLCFAMTLFEMVVIKIKRLLLINNIMVFFLSRFAGTAHHHSSGIIPWSVFTVCKWLKVHGGQKRGQDVDFDLQLKGLHEWRCQSHKLVVI